MSSWIIIVILASLEPAPPMRIDPRLDAVLVGVLIVGLFVAVACSGRGSQPR
jgi:hypothetical protein